jgi:hypothetical protein
LLLAVSSAWLPGIARAQGQQDRAGNIAMAALVDASMTSAPILSHAVDGQQPLSTMLANRQAQVIDVGQLLNPDQAQTLSDLLGGSEVLHQNMVMLRGAAAVDPALGALLSANDIPVDHVVAVDLADDTAEVVTVYVFNG